jgi:hypothetical protein
MADINSDILNTTDTSYRDCGIFSSVQVNLNPLGGTLIGWSLVSGFTAKAPFYFYVDVAYSGSDEWETLNETPIIDGCVYTDPAQRHYDHLANFYYRIRLVLPNDLDNLGDPRVHVSQPQLAAGVLSKRDWLVAREICRKEYLMQKKRTNLTHVGFILKRRRWGTECPDCIEYDTKEVQNGSCAICFGTGFTGGYFPRIDFRCTFDAPWGREFKRDEEVSLTNNIVRKARAVAYPYLDTNDIYVRRDTGERFYINSIAQIAEVGNVPIIVLVELRLAPVTDIVYTIPLEGGGPVPPPPTPEETWRVGVDKNNW